MNKGLLIVFEGLDNCGKTTQIKLLEKKLTSLNYNILLGKHPNKNTVFGKIIYDYLAGEFGPLGRWPAELIFLLYSIDRYQFKEDYEKALEKGKIVLLDRYIESGMAFQSVLYKEKDKNNFIEWIKKVEERLPQSNTVIYLDMPLELRMKLAGKKDKNSEERNYLKNNKENLDIHEKDFEFQEKVRKAYLDLAEKEKKWIVIKCFKKTLDGLELKNEKEIHEEITEKIRKLL